MITKRAVHFFYDVISPYSWIGYEILSRHQPIWKSMELKMRPLFLPALIKDSGNTPPAMIPNKAQYSAIDLARLSRYYQVPMQFPDNFFEVVLDTRRLGTLRFIEAIRQVTGNEEHAGEVSRQLWIRVFHTQEDICSQESLRQAAEKADIPSDVTDKAIEMLKDQAIKEAIINNGKEALELGAYGAPTMVVDDGQTKELLFGSDRIELLAHILGEEYRGSFLKNRSPKLPPM